MTTQRKAQKTFSTISNRFLSSEKVEEKEKKSCHKNKSFLILLPEKEKEKILPHALLRR